MASSIRLSTIVPYPSSLSILNGNVNLVGGKIDVQNASADSISSNGGMELTGRLLLSSYLDLSNNYIMDSTSGSIYLTNSSTDSIFSLCHTSNTASQDTFFRVYSVGNKSQLTNTSFVDIGFDTSSQKYIYRPQINGSGTALYDVTLGANDSLTIGSNNINISSVQTIIAGNRNVSSPTTNNGATFLFNSHILTDSTSAASSTQSNWYTMSIRSPTLAAQASNVTYTDASTLYIQGPPVSGSNMTVTNGYALLVDSGNVLIKDRLVLTSSGNNPTTDSNATSASIYVSGGISAVGNGLFLGTMLTNTISSTNTSASQLLIKTKQDTQSIGFSIDDGVSLMMYVDNTNGVSVNSSLRALSNLSIPTGQLTLGSTIDSSSNSTGTIVTSGGCSIQKTLRANKTIITSTEASTNDTSGSLIVKGGAYFEKGILLNHTMVSPNTSTAGINIQSKETTGDTIVDILSTTDDLAWSSLVKLHGRYDNVLLQESLVVGYDGTYFTMNTEYGANATKRPIELKNDTSSILIKPNGTTEISATNLSASNSTGALVLTNGGLTIACTENSTSTYGNALSVYGGAFINKDLHCKGTAFLNNLYVSGTTVTVNTDNLSVTDNFIQVNSSPSVNRNSGILFQRFQQDNDGNLGDLSSDTPDISTSVGTGSSSNTIVLHSSNSSVDDTYNGYWVRHIPSGQWRKITDYVGSSRTATISSNWDTIPSDADSIQLYGKGFATVLYDSTANVFKFGYTNQDGSSSTVGTNSLGTISTSQLNATTLITGNAKIDVLNTTNSTSSSSAASIRTVGGISCLLDAYVGGQVNANQLVTSGAITCNNTHNSSSITTQGGISISKVLNVLSTTESVSYTTGAAIISGGIGATGLSIGNSTSQSFTIDSQSDELCLINQTTAEEANINIFQYNGDGNASARMKFHRIGTSPLDANKEWCEIGFCYDTNTTGYAIASKSAGGGLVRPISIYSNSQEALRATSTNISIPISTVSSSSSTGALLVTGGIGVACTTNATSVTNGGAISIAGGISIAKDCHIGANLFVTGSIKTPSSFLTLDTSNMKMVNTSTGSAYSPVLQIFSLGSNTTDTNYENLLVSVSGADKYIIQSNKAGTGAQRDISIQSGSSNDSQLLIKSNGTVSLGSTIASTSMSTGALQVSSICITNTANSTTSYGGGLSVNGGALIEKDLVVKGNFIINGTISNGAATKFHGTDYNLAATGTANVTSVTVLNGRSIVTGTTTKLALSISVYPTSGNTKTTIKISSLPNRTVTFDEVYDIVGSTQGYLISSMEAVENNLVYASTTESSIFLTFTSVDSTQHILQASIQYINV